LVENESILLQTLGKRQVEAPVSVFASFIPHGHCLRNAELLLLVTFVMLSWVTTCALNAAFIPI